MKKKSLVTVISALRCACAAASLLAAEQLELEQKLWQTLAERRVTLSQANSKWRYRQTEAPETDWTGIDYDDSHWKEIRAPARYGWGTEADEMFRQEWSADNRNDPPLPRPETTLLRKEFEIQDPSVVQRLFLDLLFDDAAVVFLNGVEIYRSSNLPVGSEVDPSELEPHSEQYAQFLNRLYAAMPPTLSNARSLGDGLIFTPTEADKKLLLRPDYRLMQPKGMSNATWNGELLKSILQNRLPEPVWNIEVNPAALRPGKNVLAAAVYCSEFPEPVPTMVFDAELSAELRTAVPRILGYDVSWRLENGRVAAAVLSITADRECRISLAGGGPAASVAADSTAASPAAAQNRFVYCLDLKLSAQDAWLGVEAPLLIATACGSFSYAEPIFVMGPALVPAPRKREISPDVCRLQNPVIFVNARADEKTRRCAEFLAERLATDFGAAATVSATGETQAQDEPTAICLGTRDAPPPAAAEMAAALEKPEGYVLSASAKKISLAGCDTAGLWHGVQTLLALVDRSNDGGLFVWGAEIQDWPEYPWRGLMLDSGRAFIGKETFRRYISAMARLKMNVLQVHLNDTVLCGFATKKYPLIGSMARDGAAAHLTLEEWSELADYAGRHNMELIPELETLIGTGGWMHSETLCRGLRAHYGIDLLKEGIVSETFYNTLKDIFSEVAAAFKCRHFHIGADEVHGWNDMAGVREFMQRQGWQYEAEVFYYYVRRLEETVRALGCRPIIWASNNTPGYGVGTTAADFAQKTGRTLSDIASTQLICENSPGYFNKIATSEYDLLFGFWLWWGPAATYRKEGNDLAVIFSQTQRPAPDMKDGPGRRLGGLGHVWETPDYALDGIWSGLAAVAERMWSPETENIEEFARRVGPAFFGRAVHPQALSRDALDPPGYWGARRGMVRGLLAGRRLAHALETPQTRNAEFLNNFFAMLWRRLATLAEEAKLDAESLDAAARIAKPFWEAAAREHATARCLTPRWTPAESRAAARCSAP